MAQLNLYVPDELAAHLKRDARKAGLPLSRYVLSLIAPASDPWPARYFKTSCGFLHEEFPEPADPPPDPIELP